MKEKKEIFEVFAAHFVLRSFRTRFVHEAVKKPEKLYARICHNIEDVFESNLANGRHTFCEPEACIVLANSSGFRETTWADVEKRTELGDGMLIIGNSGAKFFAETEASPGAPSVVYAGNS